MFYSIYNVVSIFLILPVMAYHYYRSVSRGRAPAFAERFGLFSKESLKVLNGRPVIWLHAVSVGESIAARPLLKSLRSRYPDHAIVVSNTTETGRGIAAGFAEQDLCIYFPFDFLPAVYAALNSIKPQIVIIMETEIWPNFTREAARRSIPVLLANGRISDRSYSRYLTFSWFFRHSLQLFSQLCMQTQIDRERIVAIGAPPERTVVSGNLKYDIPYHQVTGEERTALRRQYGIPLEALVVVAGSTHSGEDEHIVAAYRSLLGEGAPLFLVLVPRHPERSETVARLLEREHLAYQRQSAVNLNAAAGFSGGEVLLVDTVGQLMKMYALADLAFVGGSLVPTGGHNLLEPASVGIPTVFGPHMTNFREIAGLVLHYGAGIQIEGADQLADTWRTLIASVELRQVLGQNGLKLMRDKSGATQQHMDVVGRYL
jgi:3-deoxy-D-manno-octulosonic-acid transferase